MIKLFTILALLFLSINANDEIIQNCEMVYEKCAILCEEKSPNDDTCYAKCEIKFDECIEQDSEESKKDSN